MPWKLIILRKAQKDLEQLPDKDRQAVEDAIDRMILHPEATDLDKMGGTANQWRLRVGRWRVLIRFENSEGTMYVLRVVPRRETYR